MVVLPRRLQRPVSRLEASARLVTTIQPKFHLHPQPNNGSCCRIIIPNCASFATTTTPERTSGRFGRYKDEYDESLHDGRRYWLDAALELDWHTPPTFENALVAHPESDRMHRWFADGVINTSYNCLDMHARARPNQRALIYDSPVTSTTRSYTYAELLDEVSGFAHALSGLGVNKGDRVVIYMPMIPEAVIAMLGCARVGAIHSVVFGGFAARELASRIDDSEPKVIVSASGGVLPRGKTLPYKSLLGEALDVARWKGVEKCVIVQREGVIECALTRGMDVSYKELMESSNEKMDAVPLPSAHVS
jgi:propionyl-CoA synthetase